MPKFLEDSQLVNAVKNSDGKAFKELYYRYADMLFRFLWRKTHNYESAKDMVQVLFMRLWNNRANLDHKQSIKSYLFRSANNLAIDHLRKKIASRENSMYEVESDPAYYPDDWFDFKDHIKKALDNLPTAQRNVFYLSRFEGLKHREIAEILGVSQKTVENHINKALKKLREKLVKLIILFIFCSYSFYI